MDRSRKKAIILKQAKEKEEAEARAKLQQQTNDAGAEEDEVEEYAEDKNSEVAEDAAEGEDGAEEEDAADEDEDAEEEEEGDGNCGSGSGKRKRAQSDEYIDLHSVPALKKRHKPRKAFDAYLKKYSDWTSTKMVVNETLNVCLFNRRIKAQKQYKGRSAAEIPLVPESVDPFQRVYIYTHGWKVRSRSVGKRPTQRTFYTGCEARFVAQAYERSNGTWGIEIKRDFYATITMFRMRVFNRIQVFARFRWDLP
ncbi:hypothetical protein PR003_g28000 [Phytophthora rubi]|uniref:Uncharacterized protein n=1 Tax=Phytophthora rubi TaxID=129364 RepID=A0A6A3HS20_9STRA|nr:hypothetical protein PR002_g26724 [Phytophthora rubi]KAE8974133.1 hypothetical protein PR001_g26091 [Phytophthora rubi]KAE9280293.1 hypothetical protein PR003_g28000 [Phytophthora rubi]